MKKWKFILGTGVILTSVMSACGSKELVPISEKVEVELGEELNENVADYVELDEKAASEAVLDLSAVDATKVGTYPASVTYKEQTAAFEVVVKDTTAPVVEVAEEVTVAAGMPLYAEEVIESITELSNETTAAFEEVETDSEEPVETTEEIEATEELETTEETEAAEEVFTIGTVTCNNAFVIYPEIGEYDNVLTVSDASGNETEITLHIVVGEAPVFSGIKDLTVTTGAKNVDYLSGITAKDCNGSDISSKIACDASSVKLDTAGKYEILYTVKDENGFQATEKATVTVTDKKGQKTSSAEENKTSSNTGSNTSSKTASTANTDKKGNAGSNGNTGNNSNTGNNGNAGNNSNTGNSSNAGNNNNASSNSNTGNNNNAGSNSNTGNNNNAGSNSNVGNNSNTGNNGNTGNSGNAGGNTDTGNNGNAGGNTDTGNNGGTTPSPEGSVTDPNTGMSVPGDIVIEDWGDMQGGADDGSGLGGGWEWSE